MKFLILIRVAVLLSLSMPLLSAVHPYHVSITTIDYNAEASTYEITCKVFRDDIEEAIEAQGTERLYLGHSDENKLADDYLIRYLENNLALSVDGSKLRYYWVGKEVDYEAVWIYLECTNVKEPSKLEISNSLLIEYLEGQENRVHVNKGKKTRSLYLDKDKTRGVVEFP